MKQDLGASRNIAFSRLNPRRLVNMCPYCPRRYGRCRHEYVFNVYRLGTKRGWFEYNFVLMGPDDLVWAQAQAACLLYKRWRELNKAYELGTRRAASGLNRRDRGGRGGIRDQGKHDR